MTSDSPHRTTRLVLATGLVLVAAVGMTLILAGLSTPGYAGNGVPNVILQAFLQITPTPLPTPVAAACGVHIAPQMRIATDTAVIQLSNAGAAATLQAITLAWPPANGELVEIKLGERMVWVGAEAGGAATVFPGWPEMQPTIKAGEQTSLTLRFSNRATEEQYIVLLHLGRSCYALFDSARVVPQLQSCFATFDRFRVAEQEAALVIRNTTTEPIAFSRLLAFWSDSVAAINSVQFDDGANLISAPADESPIDISLPTDPGLTLQPGQSSTLRLIFNERAPLVGYTFALQTGGCQSVFSNVEPPSQCPVRTQGEWQVIEQTAGLVLQNPSETDQPIQHIWLTFPTTNGALVDVTLDGASIVDPSSGLFPKTGSPASMTSGVDLLPGIKVPANSWSALSFVFENAASLRHYNIQIDFPNECPVLATTRADEAVSCQMQVEGDTPIRTDGDTLWLAVRNTGEVPAELRAVQLDWFTQFNGALTEVTIGDVPFWMGKRTEGTATVTHNTDYAVPVIEPGQSVEIGFGFTMPAVPAPYVFRLDFAEGCSLSYATQPDLTLPSPVGFRGLIHQLPPNVLNGAWQIRVTGDQVFSVRVIPQTVIVPPELIPRLKDLVSVQALPLSTDEYLATRIRVFPNIAEPIQLTGVIEEVDSQQPPRYIRVAGYTVDIALGETVIEGELRVSWLADIDGRRRADGTSVLATRIRTKQPEGPPIDFEGVVEGWQQVSDEEALWTVSGVRVKVDRSTILHGINWAEPPELNVEVQVSGTMVGAGAVRARELWYGPRADLIEFSGFIRQLPTDPQLLGIWVIEDSAVGTCNLAVNPEAEACRQVLVTDFTFLDISEASPAVGAPVRVRARQNPDGNLEALWIKVIVEQ